MKHSLKTIERIKTLRSQGFILSEIMAETGLSKTTIFHHIKNIVKSEALKRKLYVINRTKLETLAAKRRGKSVKTYPHWEPIEWSPRFINLVAHLIFDGQITTRSIIYNNRSEALINNFISEMEEYIGVSDYKFLRKSDGVLRVSYHHVEIAAFFAQKEKELLMYISDAPNEEKLAFLKAFYDDEGNVSFTSRKKLVRGYQYDVAILELVKQLLAGFGIASRIEAKFHEVCISRKADIMRFRDLINFSDGISINGRRSNSVWKESLEKKDILDKLINSYL